MSEYICPHCKKPTYDDENTLCLYCGEALPRRIGAMGRIKNLRPSIIIAIIVTLVLLCFIVAALKIQ
ncbi:MAG: hypothetical protein PHV55_04085 [Candidatus Omnitrophica bacterium]|nr:hypothetical protein [Candidatus Omnitrophota bacterium]